MNVAVVGAGPAGIAAAALLVERGLPVTLIDENALAGGSLTYDTSLPGGESILAELQATVTRPGIDWMPKTVAWAAFRRGDGFELALTDGVQERSLQVDHLVIAAGTTDRAWTGLGATLPGVMTVRAVEILVNRHGVIPAQRLGVIGVGPDSARVAALLEHCGCEVAGTFDADQVAAIGGDSEVTGILLADGRRVEADAVVVARGESPDTQLAGMLELPRHYDPNISGWRVAESESGIGAYSIGGALLGGAPLAEVVRSAVSAVERITGHRADLREANLPEISTMLMGRAVPR